MSLAGPAEVAGHQALILGHNALRHQCDLRKLRDFSLGLQGMHLEASAVEHEFERVVLRQCHWVSIWRLDFATLPASSAPVWAFGHLYTKPDVPNFR